MQFFFLRCLGSLKQQKQIKCNTWLTNKTKAFDEKIKIAMHSSTYASAPNVPVKTTAPELLAANSAYTKYRKCNIDQRFNLF